MVRLLVTVNVVPSSLILFTRMIEAIGFSETPALPRSTRSHIPEDGIFQESLIYIPEDGIFHSNRRENLKSYIALTGWTLVET
jgi:hypothetical protein